MPHVDKLTLLFLPCFVTDGWPNGHLFSVPLDTPLVADEDSETALFEDADVVVVGVAHGPSRGVLFSFLTFRRVDKPVEQFLGKKWHLYE